MRNAIGSPAFHRQVTHSYELNRQLALCDTQGLSPLSSTALVLRELEASLEGLSSLSGSQLVAAINPLERLTAEEVRFVLSFSTWDDVQRYSWVSSASRVTARGYRLFIRFLQWIARNTPTPPTPTEP